MAPIVLDNGSGMIKAGFADDDAPKAVFPNIVGVFRNRVQREAMGKKPAYVGDNTQSRKGILKLKYPMEHGVVRYWDDMESVWNYTFHDKLGVDPEEHSVLLTEVPKNPKEHKEKMTEIIFETFKVPAMYVAIPAVLSMYATNNTTGIVLDSGDSVTHVVPIYEGYALPNEIVRVDRGGRDVTDFLISILTERGYVFSSSSDREIVRDMKEKMAYVTLDDYDEHLEMAKSSSSIELNYELPDRQFVTMGAERFRCSEILFDPTLINSQTDSIPKAINNSIMACDDEIRSNLYGNIVLTGGSTMFPGFVSRTRKEMIDFADDDTKINVVAPEERKLSAWIGGSIVASLSTFKQRCMSKAEYEEYGPSFVHKKRFF